MKFKQEIVFLLENKNFLGKIKSPVGKANRGFVADLFVAIC